MSRSSSTGTTTWTSRRLYPLKVIPLRKIPFPYKLWQTYKLKNLHSPDTIDTESLSARGRSVWVHSSQVRLLDTSVPHSSLSERLGPLGTGVARNPGTGPCYPVRI